MKNLINSINQEMRNSGDGFQITSIGTDEMVVISARDLSRMIGELVFDDKLRDLIQDAAIAMDKEEQYYEEIADEEDWFLPTYSGADRVKEYMAIYRKLKAARIKELEDDGIPF